MRYFLISNGLRGCYLPDSSMVVLCHSIADLASAWSEQFNWCFPDTPIDSPAAPSAEDVSVVARQVWWSRMTSYPVVLGDGGSYGVGAQRISAAEARGYFPEYFEE